MKFSSGVYNVIVKQGENNKITSRDLEIIILSNKVLKPAQFLEQAFFVKKNYVNV